MMKGKMVESLEAAVKASGLKDGMTFSCHHHLRNGDKVMNLVCRTLENMGFRDLTLNATSIHNVHEPVAGQIERGVIRRIISPYIGGAPGRAISEGKLKDTAVFCTHGARPSDLEQGKTHIDVAFIAAPAADCMGNFSGKYGPAACGSMGYIFSDAVCAHKVVVITDHLMEYPLSDFSVSEVYVDYVVEVDSIGDPAGIVSSTTSLTRDPVALRIADYASRAIHASGLLKDGFAFQTGAGGASLAAAAYLREIMKEEKIRGSYCTGGITRYMVEMQHEGLFESLLDVQCFDLQAVEDLRVNPGHREISCSHYASPTAKSCTVDSLDVAILGATEIDTSFNVNVHTNSKGIIMGGSGGHSDAAQGAKMAMVAAPLIRARLPLICQRVNCISTPGTTIDVLVTQYGMAVNPARGDLAERFRAAKLPVFDINDLKMQAEELSGVPNRVKPAGRTVAEVYYRNGSLLDRIAGV
ncbi:MAG: citrate lyase subunit alpha [Clostridium sp.]|nr:citrate lyase subunit alpha [Clostridium sp.]